VAIHADHLALVHLLQNDFPGATPETPSYVKRLISEVIELEDHGIPFTTIDAWVRS
jgi:hypothetical protein